MSSVFLKQQHHNYHDDFSTVTQTIDGGYIASGYASSESFGNGDWTGYSGSYSYKMPFVKFDAEGNVVWKKTLGSNGSASCRKVKALSDGGIAAVGQVGWIKTAKSNFSSLTEYGRMDAVIIKLSSTGDVIWMQSYGSTGDDSFYDVIEDSDGGLITVGNNKITGGADAFLVEYYYSDQPSKTAQHSRGAAKNGTIAVSGEDEVSKGETFICRSTLSRTKRPLRQILL